VKVTGGEATPRNWVRSKTCIPWFNASLTTKAWLAWALRPRQVEFVVWVGSRPR
jgi:hypothetical protein